MAPPKKPPEYFAARKALNQHLHRHHNGALGEGTLEDRFAQHDDLHWRCSQRGVGLDHVHAPYPDGESDLMAARRLLREGEDGQADTTER